MGTKEHKILRDILEFSKLGPFKDMSTPRSGGALYPGPWTSKGCERLPHGRNTSSSPGNSIAVLIWGCPVRKALPLSRVD